MASSQELLTEIQSALAEVRETQARQLRLSTAHYDDIPGLRERLRALRRTDAYKATFDPTAAARERAHRHLQRCPISLIERAIASVQAQTYEHWEIVVVGDGCTDDTAARVEEPSRSPHPFRQPPLPHGVSRTSVRQRGWSREPCPYNRAVELCRGPWIAPLDDDDEFLPKHIDILLELALESRAEFVYGALEQITDLDVEPLPASRSRLSWVGWGCRRRSTCVRLDFFECDVPPGSSASLSTGTCIRRDARCGCHHGGHRRGRRPLLPIGRRWSQLSSFGVEAVDRRDHPVLLRGRRGEAPWASSTPRRGWHRGSRRRRPPPRGRGNAGCR